MEGGGDRKPRGGGGATLYNTAATLRWGRGIVKGTDTVLDAILFLATATYYLGTLVDDDSRKLH